MILFLRLLRHMAMAALGAFAISPPWSLDISYLCAAWQCEIRSLHLDSNIQTWCQQCDSHYWWPVRLRCQKHGWASQLAHRLPVASLLLFLWGFPFSFQSHLPGGQNMLWVWAWDRQTLKGLNSPVLVPWKFVLLRHISVRREYSWIPATLRRF